MKNYLLSTIVSSLFIASTSFAISEEALANKVLISMQITTPLIARSIDDYDDFIIELSAGNLPI